jgi:hypothetical protein
VKVPAVDSKDPLVILMNTRKRPGQHGQKLHAYALLISGLELSLRGVAGLILGAQGVPGGSPSPKKATKSEAGSFCMLARLEVIMPL